MRLLPERLRWLGAAAAAAAAGWLASLGFSETGHAACTLAGLAVLFLLAGTACGWRRAMLAGWFWGLAYFSSGLSWTFKAMHLHGGLPAPFAAAGVLALAAGLASVPMAVAGAARALPIGKGARMALVLPALWMIGEWVRGVGLMGFGWLSTGYALQKLDVFAPWAPIIGVYGMGFVAAAAVGSGLYAMSREPDPVWHVPGERQGQGMIPRGIAAAACAGLLLLGLAAGELTWSHKSGEFAARLVQPDLPVAVRPTAGMQQERLERVEAMSRQSPMGRAPDLIVWPESVYLGALERLPAAWRLLPEKVSALTNATVAFNAFHEPQRGEYFNAFWLAEPGKAAAAVYSKSHLVPFGEYVPAGFRWFINAMGIPMADQQPGALPGGALMAGEDLQLSFAAEVCYENMFGEELATWFAGEAPEVIINVANLGWFGAGAAAQFTAMSAMRARETARPVLQAVNNSHSALILPDGSLGRIAEPGAQNLDVRAPRMAGAPTPFVRWGNAPALALAALMLLAALLGAGRKRLSSLRRT